MTDRHDITHEQFVEAAQTLAIALAEDYWLRFHDQQSVIERPATDLIWLDATAARKYVRFGETKFRALVREGVLPKGVKIGGKLVWDRRELDRAMAKLFREQRRSAGRKRLPVQAPEARSVQRGTTAKKPR